MGILKSSIFAAGVVLVPGILLAQGAFTPGGIDSAALDRIVPDTIVFDPAGRNALGNWEPQTSVLGEKVFLIESNTFAEGSDTQQRFGLTFQRTDGSVPVEGEVFFADDGTPFRGPINNYRQNGNPGRVAGDKRPGAVNLIAGGEGSPNELPEFQSDDRWNTGVVRNGRFAAVQTYRLNTSTLVQDPLSKAFDAINGRLTSGDPNTDQIGRFGGDLAALDDGNFLVVVDDRSWLHAANDKVATAVIVGPDGSIVRDSFVIGLGEIWSNAAAFQGGFCVRLSGVLKFYDNAGELSAEVDQADPNLLDPLGNPVSFDRGRGDGTRIASHINSPFVFLAGKAGSDVRLAAWDSRTFQYVGQTNVNELTPANGGTDGADFRPGLDRVNLAVDALNRIVVTYEVLPAGYRAPQTAARVLAFHEEDGTFDFLTPTFFPFVNWTDGSEQGTAIRTIRPSPAITTRAICVAAKGEISSGNDPFAGADTPVEVNFYTVFAHPDPQDDPTLPAIPVAFIRGDTNDDGSIDISDAIFILARLYLGGSAGACDEAQDINDDGRLDVSDVIYLLNHLFLAKERPPTPYPRCGLDPEDIPCPRSRCNG